MKAFDDDCAPMSTLPWRASEAEILARWPIDTPLAALVSGGEAGAWSRWSILAAPTATITTLEDASEALSSIAFHPAHRDSDKPPFQSGWIGWVGYDCGRCLEPKASVANGAVKDRHWPLLCLHRCEGAFIRDRWTGQWWLAGDGAALPALTPASTVSTNAEVAIDSSDGRASELDRDAFHRRVQRAVHYVHAGDVFQVNIARRVSRQFRGSGRALFARLLESMGPWMGAIIEGPRPGQAVISVSPELLWRLDAATGRITTRPIKGTAPATEDPGALVASDKDRAELMMIIDLMRNDFGRFCEFGSIRVRDARSIERHGSVGGAGVWHGVGTVEGVVRPGTTMWDVLRACFPAGSITGAPKIRAMQIIDELEPVRRGPYCGSVGFFDDSGASELSVAIRTAVIDGESKDGSWANFEGMLDYFVGAGIVADSEPALEWSETCAKAAGFLEAIAPLASSVAGAPQ